MICLTNIKNVSYAKALAAPTPIVSGIDASYMLGDRISLNLTSTGTTKLVQYKAVLTNKDTNETLDLIKGYTVKYYNPQAKYPLAFTPKSTGKYRLVVTSKLGGYKDSYSKTSIREFTVLSNAMIISKINPLSVKSNIDEEFIFPTKISATMKDGSTKEFNVKWDNTGFKNNILGEQIFYGTVNEFSEKAKISVNVVDEKIISIDSITALVDEGNEYKLPEKITGKLKNGTIQADVKWNEALADTNKPGVHKYEGTVAGFDGKAILTLTINPVKLTLNTITVSNLKEITLSFNKKLDISTINKDNFRLFKNTALVTTDVKLMEDNKTVVLSVSTINSALENMGRYSLVVEGVKDLNGNVIEKSIKDILAEDVKVPEILSISATGPYNFLMEFSEPIRNTASKTVEVKLGNTVISSSPILSGFETNKINVGLSTAMVENSKYDVNVKGFMDFAARQMTARTYQLTYKKNVNPIVAKVDKVDPAYVILSFNKPVRGLTKDNFYLGDASKKAIGIYSDFKMTKAVIPSQSLDLVWVKFYDSKSKTGNTIGETLIELSVLAKASGYEILDSWGNSFLNTNIPVSAVWDKTAPEVLEIKNDTEASVMLQFSEEVKFNLSNIEVLDEKEGKINFVIQPDSDNRYKILLGQDYSGNNIRITLKDVEDRAIVPNKLTTYTESILITDKTPPLVKNVSKRFVSGLDNSLYISFNESVNQTALNIDNYYIQNPTTSLMTKLTEKPVFYEGSKFIRLPLTDTQKNFINNGYNLFVNDVQDLYNNKLVGQVVRNANIANFDSNDNRPKIIKLEAISKDQLRITFDQYLKTVDNDGFLLNGMVPKSCDLTTNSEGNSIVTLVTEDDRLFTSGLEGSSLYITTDSTSRIENAFGLGISNSSYTSKTSPIKIEDKMGPNVRVISGTPQVKAIRGNTGIVDAIVVEYEENIDSTKLSALSYKVNGRDIARVYTSIYPLKGTTVTGSYVIIELKPVQSTSTVNNYATVTQVLDIYDMQGNKLSPDGTALETIN
jgi:hypothetical protein